MALTADKIRVLVGTPHYEYITMAASQTWYVGSFITVVAGYGYTGIQANSKIGGVAQESGATGVGVITTQCLVANGCDVVAVTVTSSDQAHEGLPAWISDDDTLVLSDPSNSCVAGHVAYHLGTNSATVSIPRYPGNAPA